MRREKYVLVYECHLFLRFTLPYKIKSYKAIRETIQCNNLSFLNTSMSDFKMYEMEIKLKVLHHLA